MFSLINIVFEMQLRLFTNFISSLKNYLLIGLLRFVIGKKFAPFVATQNIVMKILYRAMDSSLTRDFYAKKKKKKEK